MSRRGTLFSGDLWLAIRSRVLHSSEDPYEIVESLRRAAALGPSRMFDAHRGLVENPVAALNAKADWLGEMMEAIAREIAEGRSDREIVNRLLEGEYRSAYISGGDYSRGISSKRFGGEHRDRYPCLVQNTTTAHLGAFGSPGGKNCGGASIPRA
jgi:hypothetical protein